jgi:hypothetical protein
MPGKPAPGNRNRVIRMQDDLWAAFAKACDQLGMSRNQRLIQHAQNDVDQWRESAEKEDQ